MPPRRYSRHQFTATIRGTGGLRFQATRERFGYRDLRDTITHVVTEGETLHEIAGRYYRALARGCGLWWVIADFQPEPIHDPTVQLLPGTVLFVPTVRAVIEQVFNKERLRREATP